MQALRIDSALLAWPGPGPWRGQVHSVFRHVVNVETGEGGLYTLASRGVDCAPDTLVVDAADFTGAGIACGDPVERSGDALVIAGRLDIRLERALPWNCVLPGFPAGFDRLRTNLARVGQRLDGRARPGALATECRPLLFQAEATLKECAGRLCDALRAGDLAGGCAQAQALLGLGAGLTPSGDDFLVGFFAVLHLPGHPRAHWRRICAPVLAQVERRTGTISTAALRAAETGRVRESIVALLRQLMVGSPQELAPALERVLAIGSSSGADIVAGVRAGLEAALRAVPDRRPEVFA